MKNAVIYLLALLLFTIAAPAQEELYDLYLLIGQSNMAGRGLIEAQDSEVHPRVFTLNKDNNWVPAQDPIHFDKKVAGVGLGRTFGLEMAKANPDKIIGLIPCAVGGSPIDSWQAGGYHSQTKMHPWDDMENRLAVALKKGSIKGILWHQGESDSNPELCYEYKTKLEDLIKRIRKVAKNDNAPFVAGEFGRFKQKENKKQYPVFNPSPAQVVMQSTKEVVRKDGNAAFVKTNGLAHKGDHTHFDARSYRVLGKRYAMAMLKLQKRLHAR